MRHAPNDNFRDQIRLGGIFLSLYNHPVSFEELSRIIELNEVFPNRRESLIKEALRDKIISVDNSDEFIGISFEQKKEIYTTLFEIFQEVGKALSFDIKTELHNLFKEKLIELN